MNKIVALIMIFGLNTVAYAAVYSITDVVCRSGEGVNMLEAPMPGRLFKVESPLETTALTDKIRVHTLDNQNLQKILQDSTKQILAQVPINVGFSYRSGRGPCGQGDEMLVIGKRVE